MPGRLSVAAGYAATLLACSGCALKSPPMGTPAVPAAFENATFGAPETWPSREWYQAFGSDELTTLIRQAAEGNLDIVAAGARLRQADAQARQAGAAILPSVDANGAGNFLAGRSGSSSAHEVDWSALLSASYEVDFWGRNHALASAAQNRTAAARADRETVALTTLAGVASSYFEVLSLRERVSIAESNVAAARSLLAVVQNRFDAGASDPVTLATQRTVLATAQLALSELRQRDQEAQASLALMIGQPPEGFRVLATSLQSVREPAVTPGLPAQLLLRRPDVSAAEANLKAADADLLAARAAMLPNFTLTAAAGIQNPALNAAILTLSGTGPTVNVGATLIQGIFDAGSRRAARDEARARQEELVANYRKAILASLVDVENALAAIHSLDAARAIQDENLAQSERAFAGAQARYREGAGDFLTVLEAQRTLYAARDQFNQYRLARLWALVTLCKSLGGGWELQK